MASSLSCWYDIHYNGLLKPLTIAEADIPFLMGTYPQVRPQTPPQPDENSASKYYQDMMASFIRDSVKGLEDKYEWPQFNQNSTTLIELFDQNQPTGQLVNPGIYDYICTDPPPIPWSALQVIPPTT
jgi:hypothetical protein